MEHIAQPPSPARDFLNPAEAARLLRVQPATLRQWRYLKRGPAYHRVGGRVVYSAADLAAFVARQESPLFAKPLALPEDFGLLSDPTAGENDFGSLSNDLAAAPADDWRMN